MITRRCSERRFFLSPSALVFAVFVYVLTIAARRKGILVHAVCVLGNHYHAIVTDPRGEISEFCRYLHEFTSKCLNSSRGRFENMWAITETSRVSLEDADAVVREVDYTLNNPSLSGLIPFAEKWPGLRMWWADKPVTVKRPAFFRDNGVMPAEVTLEMVPPPAFADMPDTGIEMVNARLAETGASIRKKAAKEGRKFVGMARIMRQRWDESPTSFAKRMKMRPRVATRDRSRRLAALARNKQFRLDHAGALAAWRAGNRDVIFPAGTYKMRVVHGVRCAEQLLL